MGLTLKMFGGFSVRDGSGTVLSLRTRKTRALLAYLAVNSDRPQSRERLMALLWSDRSDRQARQSLNYALKLLRALPTEGGAALFDSDGEQVTLHGAALESDVGRFQALRGSDPAGAVAFYEGQFLDGLSIPAAAFEEWLATMRSAFETDACDTLQRAADAAAGQGDNDQAIAFARRLAALDPLREDAHRRLMRYLYVSGDRVAALRQYQACADILKAELQVSPDAATRALFEEIRRDEPRPVSTSPGPTTDETPPSQAAISTFPTNGRRKRLWGAAAVAAFLLVASAGVFVGGGGTVGWFAPKTEPVATNCPQLVDKPSVAVLPFENLSGDPTQAYLSDGISEDVITRLARRPDMIVIARTSSFAYRSKSVTVPEIARQLGAGYVLEGSVRKAGNRIRISAQLIEAATGNLLWAEVYERETQQLFAMQDEIAYRVAVELAATLSKGELARVVFKSTNNYSAYDYFLRGFDAYEIHNKKAHKRARELFRKAIEHDPKFARAIAALGWVYMMQRFHPHWGYDPEQSTNRAKELASRALAIDENSATAHALLGWFYAYDRQYEKAIIEGKRAVAIEPSNPMRYVTLARTMMFAGRLKEAAEQITKALCLSPYPPMSLLSNESWINYHSGRYEAAIAASSKMVARNAGRIGVSLRRITASYMALGRENQARAAAKKHNEYFFKRRGRPYSLKRRIEEFKSRPWKDPSWIDIYAERLRKAGIPK